jgi:urease accessory protein
MRVIERVIERPRAEQLRGKTADMLALTWEQRRWVRGRFTTPAGREIALALPTGAKLIPGMVLLVEPDAYVEIAAAPEPVLAISPKDYTTAIRVAFEVGNRHFPLALKEPELLVPDDPAMAALMERLGVAFERRLEPFEPLGSAAGGAHRHDP